MVPGSLELSKSAEAPDGTVLSVEPSSIYVALWSAAIETDFQALLKWMIRSSVEPQKPRTKSLKQDWKTLKKQG